MDFRGREVDFQGADRRYEELKRQRDGGSISEEEFDEQLKDLMVQDESGRWWVKSRKSGEWHYNDGSSWVAGTPLGYSPSTDDQNRGRQRPEGILLASGVGILVLVALVVGVLLVLSQGEPIIESETSRRFREIERIDSELPGKTIAEAGPIAGGDYKLRALIVDPSPQPKGTIISTTGPTAEEPDLITLTLSGGEENVTVPDVSGLSALEAGKVLLDAGLDPHVIVYFDQSGNAVTATSRDDDEEKDVSTTKITSTFEEAGSVVPASEGILLKALSPETGKEETL
jgi:hypothetical protein